MYVCILYGPKRERTLFALFILFFFFSIVNPHNVTDDGGNKLTYLSTSKTRKCFPPLFFLLTYFLLNTLLSARILSSYHFFSSLLLDAFFFPRSLSLFFHSLFSLSKRAVEKQT